MKVERTQTAGLNHQMSGKRQRWLVSTFRYLSPSLNYRAGLIGRLDVCADLIVVVNMFAYLGPV